MAYKAQNWNDYDENKSETFNIENGAVVTSERMNNIEAGIVANYIELNQKKADQAFVDAQFSAIISGAPKGTFNTLKALETKYPNGTEGIFLVLENGHWYYWNSSIKKWTDGGVYQSSKLLIDNINIPTENLVKDGDFKNYGEGWHTNGGTSKVANNTFEVTGNGSLNRIGINSTNIINVKADEKLYLKSRIRVTDTKSLALTIFLTDGESIVYLDNRPNFIEKPISKNWYDISGDFYIPKLLHNKDLTLHIVSRYIDQVSSNGSKLEIYGNVVMLNNSKTFGLKTELQANDIFEIIKKYPRQYFDGIVFDFLSLDRFINFQSSYHELLHDAIGKDIHKLNDNVLFKATNEVIGGDFRDYGKDWYKVGGTGSVNQRVFSVIGDGSLNRVGISTINENKILLKGTNKYYFKNRLRIRSSGAKSITIYLTDGEKFIYLDNKYEKVSNPQHDIWYNVDGFFDIPIEYDRTKMNLYIIVTFDSSIDSQNKVFESYGNSMLINLSEAFRLGNEPRIELVRESLQKYPNEFFNDSVDDFVLLKDLIYAKNKTKLELKDKTIFLAYDTFGNLSRVETTNSDGVLESTSDLNFNKEGLISKVTTINEELITETTLNYKNNNLQSVDVKRSELNE